MNLIRPNGLVARLWLGPRQQVELENYGRVQLGPATAETLRLGAQRDQRQKRRRRPDPLRGRVVDLPPDRSYRAARLAAAGLSAAPPWAGRSSLADRWRQFRPRAAP